MLPTTVMHAQFSLGLYYYYVIGRLQQRNLKFSVQEKLLRGSLLMSL